MSKKSLLVISNHYLTFVKDQFETMSENFGNIDVLVRFHRYYSLFPEKLIDVTNKPLNINCIKSPIIYIPTDPGYRALGEKHFKIVDQIIKKNNLKFDLIHSHFTWSSGYVGAKLKEKYGVPFVVTAHGYDIYELPFKDDEWKSKIEYVLNAADAIITVSNSNLECIKKLDVKTPVTVIPNGYREDLFYPLDPYECRRSLGLPSDKKIILTVGNLEEVKGHIYLVKAMDYVVKTRKDVICYIVGGGKLENKLKTQLKFAGLQDYIKLVGGRPHDEIPLWMNACDIFVLPSLNEGNPTVMFECLGCGKPFVGTKVGGIPEIIVSEDYGMIVEPGNSKDLAKNIELALEKKWCSKDIRNYGQRFIWENITKEIYDIYVSSSN